LPISCDAIASLCGVGKHHGVGEPQDAARIALRLPAFCGVPTREEAEQVLDVSVARQHEFSSQLVSLTQQRREVLSHPERLESLRLNPDASYVELIPRPKSRSNNEVNVNMSTAYENLYGPQLASPNASLVRENMGPPNIDKMAMNA
jgi:hypothetical protein